MSRKTGIPAALALAGCLVGWLAGAAARAQEALPIHPRGDSTSAPTRPVASQPAGSQPASGPAATEKGPWADAAVGLTVTLTLAGNVTQTREVVKADANTVTIRTTITVAGIQPVESEIPRLYTPEQMQQILEGMGQKTGEQTLQVGGKECPCEIYERVMVLARSRVVNRMWLCKQVPGWSVRVDNDASGEMTTISQIVEYKIP